ncbi:hypothetical protein [Enterococcus sp. DIV0876]|uniref:hypothetical protein n=1 Tax=Enterococcus sp. DIV0876 TaxID=2774633 RepID=UPI003D300677
MKTKNYLVACYDNKDKIFMMQEMMLIINIDSALRGKFSASVKKSEIFSDERCIRFVTKAEIDSMTGVFFFGMRKSERFSCLAEKEKYDRIFERSIRQYGENDRDRFLGDLVKKVQEEGRSDVYQKLEK